MHFEPNVATILIVEDDTTLGEILARVLTHARQRAVSVSSPAHALRLVEAQWPRVVLLDICRRDGTALELAQAIRASAPHLPLILLTEFPQQGSVFLRRVNRHVTKSINLSDLRQMVEAELAQGDASWKPDGSTLSHNQGIAASTRFALNANR